MSSKQASSSAAEKFVTTPFSVELGQVLEERSARIRVILQTGKAINRSDLTRFIWGTGRAVRQCIKPDLKDEYAAIRTEGWQHAKGMLKDIVDWEKFTPAQFHENCAKAVLEKKVSEVIENYKHFVMTGEIQTKHPPPKLLGETDQILVVDKPCNYTCSYGGGNKNDGDGGEIPELNWNAKSPSALLNGSSPFIQIHQYLGLKYNYETAVETRKWWETGCKELPCAKACGRCEECACIQSGCCHRLDKETSGVLVVSKTKRGFVELREQFKSEHALEEGGIEKYYVALAHGEVKCGPDADDVRCDDWKHTNCGGKGRVEISEFVDTKKKRAYCYNNPQPQFDQDSLDKRGHGAGRQHALTFYEPVAWFTRSEDNQKYTFVYLRIITGRYHQIRFHMSEIGHPLVGDPRYGAPWSDREWAQRVFLHSYTSKFREPQTYKWYQAISPLPPDLGAVLAHESFKLDRLNEAFFSARGSDNLLLSRREHPSLDKLLKQYDPKKRLLTTHDTVELSAQAALNLQRTMPQMVAPPVTSSSASAGQQASSPSKPAAPPKTSGEDSWNGGWKDWGQGGASGDAGWNGGDWKQGDGWSSWQGGGSWSGDPGWQPPQQQQAQAKPLEIKPVAKAEAKPKVTFTDEDDDDDWGGWSAPAAAQTQAGSPGGKRPAPAAAEAEPPAQKPRVEDSPSRAPAAVPKSPPRRPQAAAPQATVPQAAAPQAAAAPPPGAVPSTPPATRQPAPPQVKWQRMESRTQAGVYYYWDPVSGQTMADPPPPWEKKQSRTRPDIVYWWNSQTNLTSAEKPVV